MLVRQSGSRRTFRRGVGRTEVLIGVAVVAVLALVSVPILLSTSKKSARAEVPLNVDAIRAAQLEYQSAFGNFIEADPAPRDPLAANGDAVAWEPSEGFRMLSWAPASAEVRGVYSVSVKRDDFTVTGICDVDADGTPARWQATRADSAKALTEPAVY